MLLMIDKLMSGSSLEVKAFLRNHKTLISKDFYFRSRSSIVVNFVFLNFVLTKISPIYIYSTDFLTCLSQGKPAALAYKHLGVQLLNTIFNSRIMRKTDFVLVPSFCRLYRFALGHSNLMFCFMSRIELVPECLIPLCLIP